MVFDFSLALNSYRAHNKNVTISEDSSEFRETFYVKSYLYACYRYEYERDYEVLAYRNRFRLKFRKAASPRM